MTIKDAIDELIKVRSQKQQAIKAFENSNVDVNKNEFEIARYIVNRLDCIIEDLTNHMMSPIVGESFELDENISKQIENKSSAHAIVDKKWVATLDYSILSLFRHNECKKYYEQNEKRVKKTIDGETWSKAMTVITAIITIVLTAVAIGLHFYGIGQTNDGGLDFDLWAFITATIGAVVIIIGWIVELVYNRHIRKKYDNTPYSIEELMAIKYENDSKKLGFRSPFEFKQIDPPTPVRIIHVEHGSTYQEAEEIVNNNYTFY